MSSYSSFQSYLVAQLDAIQTAGTFKRERTLTTPQGAMVETTAGKKVLNLCANNYLGLAQHPRVRQAAHQALDEWGYGLASVRFICGTQGVHKELEASLSDFLGTDDTILYGSCFDANGGLFETLLGPEDAIISDELNHASIIDGIRLCKAKRLRDTLEANARFFRQAITAAGFQVSPGVHPIVPIMLGDAALAAKFAEAMLEKGVYVIGFSFPVVPQGKARIRTQISAAHTREDLEFAVKAFTEVKCELGLS